jgi:hypothetical protein
MKAREPVTTFRWTSSGLRPESFLGADLHQIGNRPGTKNADPSAGSRFCKPPDRLGVLPPCARLFRQHWEAVNG